MCMHQLRCNCFRMADCYNSVKGMGEWRGVIGNTEERRGVNGNTESRWGHLEERRVGIMALKGVVT